MNEVLLIAAIAISIALLCVVVWLIGQYRRIKREITELRSRVEGNTKDIAGLCSAAVSVDSRLSENGEQLQKIAERVVDFEQYEQQTSQPYHSAIQKIRNGASAEELIKQCGLSRDEAVLLIRLHGND